MKIKKEEKMQIEKLPTLKLKYTLVVPFMGIVDALTMGNFFMNPATDGKLLIKAFYVICGIAGILFALWGLLWKTTIDGKTIKVNPVIGKKKVVPFSDLKKAVVYKKKKTGSIVSYELIDKNNQSIVTILLCYDLSAYEGQQYIDGEIETPEISGGGSIRQKSHQGS